MLKKCTVLLFTLIMAVGLLSLGAFAAWDGTADSSWTGGKITTEAQLAQFAVMVNSGNSFENQTVTLGANLDLSGSQWTPIGDSNSFKGTFDGKGHSITGLTIENSTGSVGLFGNVGKSGTVKNVSVSGIITGEVAVGGVVYYNSGTVANVSFDGTITSTRLAQAVGGVVGSNDGTIINSYNKGTIKGAKAAFVGGVAGANSTGVVANSYNIGTVTSDGSADVGGVVGLNYGTINYAYSLSSAASGEVVASDRGTTTNISTFDNTGALLGVTINGTNYTSLLEALNAGVGVYNATPPSVLARMWKTSAYPTIMTYWEDYADDTWTGGEITTAAQLAQFSKLVNGGNSFANQTVTLGADLDLSAHQWTPIGVNNSFEGTFDGKNRVISGLKINSNSFFVGLFSYVGDSGVVKNLSVNGAISSTGDTVGGVVGENKGAVTNVSFGGTILAATSSAYVGGVVGDNEGEIANSSNNATITGGDMDAVGGVVGENSGTVTNVYNTGAVMGGDTARVGGVMGQNSNIVTNVYNTGTVEGGNNAYVGGVMGINSSTATNMYNTNAVNGGDTARVGGVVGYGSSGSVKNAYNTGTITGGTSAAVGDVVGNNASCLFSGVYYLSGSANEIYGSNSGHIFNYKTFVTNGTLSEGVNIGGASRTTLLDALNAGADEFNGSNTSIKARGWQTKAGVNSGYPTIMTHWEDYADDTWTGGEITTAAQLAQFSKLVNGGNSFENQTVTLGANLDLSGRDWTPIGNKDNFFKGTFDGKNRNITGVTINNGENHVGLFGYVDQGTVKDVAVEGTISITGNAGGIGGVVASIYNGNVTNVSFGGTVFSTGRVGVIGGVIGFSENGTITNVYNTGDVTGADVDFIGGVMGYIQGGFVTNVYNTGNVTAMSNDLDVGGVVGTLRNTAVTNAHNTGTVKGGIRGDVGGVVGINSSSGTVTNSYNTGAVIGEDSSKVGGIVGRNIGVITNVYNTGTITGEDSSKVGGIAGDNADIGEVTIAYSTGTATGGTSSIVGAIAGNNEGNVEDTYCKEGLSHVGNNNALGSTTFLDSGKLVSIIYVAGHGTDSFIDVMNILAIRYNKNNSSEPQAKLWEVAAGNTYPTIDKREIINFGSIQISDIFYGDTPTVSVAGHSGAALTYMWNNTNALPTHVGTHDIYIFAETATHRGAVRLQDFTITAKPLSASMIADIAAVTYDGSAHVPNVTVTNGSTPLLFNTDYTVSYASNTDAGTAKVTITAKSGSNYSGIAEKTFVINKATLTGTLTISNIAAAVNDTQIADISGMVGTHGTDYTLQWTRDNAYISGATNANYVITRADGGTTLSVKAIGQDNYTGEVGATNINIPPMVPDAPIVNANAGNGQVTVTWTKPLDGGDAITKYKILNGTNSIILANTETSYSFVGLENGKEYTFTVSAINGIGESSGAVATATPTSPPEDVEVNVYGNQTDELTKIRVMGDIHEKLSISEIIGNTSLYEELLAELSLSYNPILAVDISVGDVNGYVRVDFPIASMYDGRNYQVIHKMANGEFETFTGVVENSNILVRANEISSFMVAIEGADVTEVVTQNPFTDIDSSDWFYDSVMYVYANGIMSGVSETQFEPSATATRAMIWTVLARLDGVDTEGGDMWYSKALDWSIAKGISDGSEAGGNITREQLVTMLYRYEQSLGGGFTGTWAFPLDFADASNVSDWAYEAMCYMSMNGVITGKDGNVLDPSGTATRAEIATMIMRYMEMK